MSVQKDSPLDPRPDGASRLNRLVEAYVAAGLPLTSQRRVLIEVLAGRADHPTVDQIHSAVVQRLPEVSRTTVYRSLETLMGLELLRRVEHPGSAVRIDVNMELHHHFLCVRCGGLSDLPLEAVSGAGDLVFVAEPPGVVHEVAVLVRGTCAGCVGRAQSEARGTRDPDGRASSSGVGTKSNR